MPNRTGEIAGSPAAAMSRIGQRRQVIISKQVFDALRLKEGDFVEVTAQGGLVSMKPQKLLGSGDTLSSTEAKKVRHALKQAKAGKTRPWNQIKHELGL